MSDELYMDASPKNTKNCILVCEESYKLLQQEIAKLRQAKEKAEAEVERWSDRCTEIEGILQTIIPKYNSVCQELNSAKKKLGGVTKRG